MDAEQLNNLLFDRTVRLFVILDAGQFTDLPKKLWETEIESHCLLEGALEPDVLYQAPYLVRLLPKHPFTDWLFNGFVGKNRGIFAHSKATLIEMRSHFTQLVKVADETGRPLLFRYYDPRVFRKFVPTCKKDELEKVFGDVNTFFVEDENESGMLRYDLSKKGYTMREVGNEGGE